MDEAVRRLVERMHADIERAERKTEAKRRAEEWYDERAVDLAVLERAEYVGAVVLG